jgi:hypothetical protein
MDIDKDTQQSPLFVIGFVVSVTSHCGLKKLHEKFQKAIHKFWLISEHCDETLTISPQPTLDMNHLFVQCIYMVYVNQSLVT